MKNKKVLKWLMLGTTVTTIAIGTVLLSTFWWGDLKVLSSAGSSSVQPLIAAMSNVYKTNDVVTQSGGSTTGINAAFSGTKSFGMSSKNPFKTKSEKYTVNKKEYGWNEWGDKEIKTTTIAWDGMALIYKPVSPNNAIINLNNDNFAKMYHAFSGSKSFKLSDFGVTNDNSVVTPYARTGGSKVSGTADAFFFDSNSLYQDSSYWKNLLPEEQKKVIDILKNGNYNSNVKQTSEANSQAWQMASKGDPGTMVYLSAGFVLNNIKEIERMGFKVATYGDTSQKLSVESITNGYNWYRPLNIMYSIKNIQEPIKNFTTWILENPDATNIIKTLGFIPLNSGQINSMIAPGKDFFTSSDLSIGRSGAK